MSTVGEEVQGNKNKAPVVLHSFYICVCMYIYMAFMYIHMYIYIDFMCMPVCTESGSPALQTDSLLSEPLEKPYIYIIYMYVHICVFVCMYACICMSGCNGS